MARENGGGGAFAWTLLGFLAGVAATLGIQLLMNGPTRGQNEEPASASPHIAVAASSAPAVKKVEAAPSAAPVVKRAQPDAEVADDAAAAGMTSRTNSAPAEPEPDAPANHPAPAPGN